MRFTRIAVVGLAGLWLAGEVAAIPFAESRVETAVAERTEDAAAIRADIDSFPMVTRLLITGEVNELTVTLERISRLNLTFAEIDFRFEGVEIDRTALLRQDPRVESIDRGTVTGRIDAGALSSVLGRALSLAGADVRVQGRSLVVGPASVRLPPDLIPCEADVRVEGEQIVVSCTIEEIPDYILESAQGV